jgi:hypothetical protein
VSGKNNKILPIPETMQGISTSAESKEERSKKKKKINNFRSEVVTTCFSLRRQCSQSLLKIEIL